VLLDGAQSISHMSIDVQDLGCDFFVFSGHKVFAPTGIGVVYGRKALLDSMPPWQGGGNMIKDVTFEKIEFQPAPFRFEAGTGTIADAVGLGEALKYLERIGMSNIALHEHAVLDYALARLKEIRGLRIIGNAKERAGVISLLLDGLEPGEVGKALNQKGIAVRAGHHCALPILRRFGVEATVRPSFALYNTFEEVDRLTDALREISVNGR
jgi:cysteine desulfurase/selenocysteine lyase